jgi:hypothetical protein
MWPWPNCIIPRHLPRETEENSENTCQDSRCPGRDLNQGTPEYEAGVLATRPRN